MILKCGFCKKSFLSECTTDQLKTFSSLLGTCKGQMMSECIYDIIDFPKYHRKKLPDFCPENLFRLGMLCTHLSRVNLRLIKTNHMYKVYKTFQGRNLSEKFGGILENQ